MTSVNQAVQQSIKHFFKSNFLSTKRVVSTSPRKHQGALALQMDIAENNIQKCPFLKLPTEERETLDTPMDTPKTHQVSNVQPFDNIPGPKGLPIVGTLFDYFKKNGPRFNKMFQVQQQRSAKYGEIYYEKIADFESVIVSSPEEYNRLVRSEGKYPCRREMAPMAYYNRKKGYALGIVNSQGKDWYNLRTVVSKKMLKLSEVSRVSENVGEVADDFIQRLSALRDSTGQVPDLDKELFKWAMESIGTFLFEERIGCLGNQPTQNALSFIENLSGFFQNLQVLMYSIPLYKIWPSKTWKKFENCSDKIMTLGDMFVEKKIASMQDNKDSKSALISHLVSNGTLSRKEITGLMTELLSAAVETTSSALTWALYSLARNPQVQADLFDEITEAKSKNGGTLSAEKLAKLPLVKAVLKETLRLYPISYTSSRYIQDDIQLCGYTIPAGTHVQANLYGMFHNPDYFPEPETFLPERWLKENKMDATIKSASQLVWGHGARMCLGRRLAEQELHITIAKIIENFQLNYHGDEVQPILNTTMVPDRPVNIQFSRRQISKDTVFNNTD